MVDLFGLNRLATQHTHNPPFNTNNHTGAQPLTSPATSVEIDATQVVLVPKRVRGLISDFKATKTKEWEAAEQRWQAWTAEQEQEGNGSA